MDSHNMRWGAIARRTMGALLVAALAGCAPPEERSMNWTPPALAEGEWQEPDGREVLQHMANFMAGHDQLVTEARVSYQAVQESGQKLHFDLLQRMAVGRPDRFFWITVYDDGSADSAWFAGGEFTLLRQPANVWGQIDGPATIPAMVDRLVTEYNLKVPFGDLLGRDPGVPLYTDAAEVWWVGEAWVEGYWTNHVAIRQPGVDFEIWVRKGDQPFPAKMAIVYVDDEGQPTHVARFQKWSTTIPNAIREFTFTPSPDAERVQVVPVSAR